MAEIRLLINGKEYYTDLDPMTRLLDFIREELKLTGTKESCGVGECGSCSVLMNEDPVTSCLIAIYKAQNKEIKTIEYLAKTELGELIIECFDYENAVQCGFCFPGFLVTTYAYVKKFGDNDRTKIREYLAGNICRCTGYQKIIDAVVKVCNEWRKNHE